MTNNRFVLSIILSLFSVLFVSCDAIEDLISPKEWPSKCSGHVRTQWSNENGSLQLIWGTNAISMGDITSIIISSTSNFTLIYNGHTYQGWNGCMFMGLSDDQEVTLNGLGNIKLSLKKVHSESDITIEITGALKLGPVRIKEVEWEESSLSAYLINDYSGSNLTEVTGVTADGQTQLFISFNDDCEDIESVSYQVLCNGIVLDNIEDVGTFSNVCNLPGIGNGVIYTAPSEYRGDINTSITNYDIYITAKRRNNPIINKRYHLPAFKIARPGIVFIAGLFGLGDDSFKQTIQYFERNGYNTTLMNIVSFPSSGTSQFDHNIFTKKVIQKGIKSLHDNLLSNYGIASSNYTLMGYSMGGILARLYAQNVDNRCINRIITINTPHYGSELASFCSDNLLPTLNSQFTVKPYRDIFSIIELLFAKSAFYDLASGSDAIKDLNGANALKEADIPEHAFCSVLDMTQDDSDFGVIVQRRLHSKTNFVEDMAKTYNFFMREAEQHNMQLFYDGESDGIVSLASQCCKMTNEHTTIMSAPYKGPLGLYSETHHLHICSQEYTHSALFDLATEPTVSDKFLKGGFIAGSKKEPVKRLSLNDKEQSSSICINFSESNDDWIRYTTDISNNILNIYITQSPSIADNLTIITDGENHYVFSSGNHYELEFDNGFIPTEIYIIGKTKSGLLVASKQ